MKKQVVVPYGIALMLAVLSGFYFYRSYTAQVEVRREMLKWYASDSKTQLKVVAARVRELPYMVKPIAGESDWQNTDIARKYAENISLLKQFYVENSYFTRGISVYNRYGDVFNIYRDRNDEFIIDTYKAHSASVLRSATGLVADNHSFSVAVPVYQDSVLAGNVAVELDVMLLQQEIFKSFPGNDSVWPTLILDEKTALTPPLDEEWVLSHERDITWGVWERKSGFVQGSISSVKGVPSSARVITYYESLMIPEYCLGIAYSYNVSPMIASSVRSFTVVAFILFALATATSFILNRMVVRYTKTLKRKEQEIRVLQTIYHYSPVGIIVNQDNRFFSGNNNFFTLFDDYISIDDTGKNMNDLNFPSCFQQEHEPVFEDWDLCKFDRKGAEICLGRRQMSFDLGESHYIIDTFWDVTEIQQRLEDTVQSAITKSELLNRVGADVKKTFSNVRNTTALLMQHFPEEEHIAYINRSATSLVEMLDDVQDYAGIEAGQIILEEVPFNIVEEIKKMTDRYTLETKSKGIELQVHIAPSSTRNIVGDPQRFRQVLNELLSNAVKFTEEGSIRISLETVSLQEQKIMVKCSVEDTGLGMPHEKLKKLFSFDFRAMEENNPIGLGIIITKKLVEMMGGTMRVTSPSPISTDSAAPGMQFLFSAIFLADRPLEKHLNYSSIVSFQQLNVLIITTDENHVNGIADFLQLKNINTDIFIYNSESTVLLINKLIIDNNRYQMIIISTANSEMSFIIAEEINRNDLAGNCLYVLVDACDKKINYIRAKSLNMDYYFVKNDDLSVFDSILNTQFPNLLYENTQLLLAEPQREIKILIAEHNELSQKVAEAIFKSMNLDVDFVPTTPLLLKQLDNKKYDIIFIDLKFPPNSGFEIVEMLRRKGIETPVIAMTSNLTKENRKRIADSTINGFLTKPLTPDGIKQILKKHIK